MLRAVAGRTPDAVLDMLRGRPGSTVSVALRRAAGPVQRLSVIREQVREIPVRARILEPRVGYLRLPEFTERAHEDVGRALARLTGQGARALVLDLRENGYRTRAGRAVEGVGLAPDVAVLTPRERVQGPGDTQFEIARLLARRRLESTGQPATARP